MVDEALAETGRTEQRIRDLPSRVVVYLLLAGALFRGIGWQQVWQRLTAGEEGLQTATPTAGALAQTRRRVGAGHCTDCSTGCVDRLPGSAPWERGGGACSSALSTAR